MKKNFLKDPITQNIWYLSLLVFVLSLQALIVLVFVYQFVPLPAAPTTEGVPEALLKLFKPNRNLFFITHLLPRLSSARFWFFVYTAST